MSIHSGIIAGTIVPEATFALEWLGSGEEEETMALCEAVESAVSAQTRPLKFTSCLNQFFFLLQLGRVTSVPGNLRSPER